MRHLLRFGLPTGAALALVAVSLPGGPGVDRAEAQEDPVALVIRVQGDVDVRHGTDDPTPAAVGERMFAGDAVLPSDGARAVLITRAGGQQIVTEETTLSEPRGGGNPDIFARAVTTLAQAAAVDPTAGGRQGMIRPMDCGVAPIAPRNGLLVTSPHPTFAWTSGGDAARSYDLMVRRVDGGRPEIFEVGTDTTFTLPEDAALERGATYTWTVFPGGRRTGRPCQARTNPRELDFRVMSLEESVELEDYMDEIAVFGLDPMTDGLFLTVVAYTDMGLYYDAFEALARVEQQAELSSDLYLLMGEILVELGREEAARDAFDRAAEATR